MTIETVHDLVRGVLISTLWISLPILAAGVIVGVLVSLGQIVTSIQDPAVGAVPRLIVMGLVIALLLPWMSGRLVYYTQTLWSDFSRYAR
jgi:flagellar biosynthesis protein FliQ